MKSNLRIAWEIIEEWPASCFISQAQLVVLAGIIARNLDSLMQEKIVNSSGGNLDAIGTDKCKVSVEGGLK